jgi:hypothetical protein
MLLVALAASAAAQRPSAPAQAVPAQDTVSRNEQRDDPRPAPARAEGEGPFTRLIVRGATLIDGYGGPPRGPVDIVIEVSPTWAIPASR